MLKTLKSYNVTGENVQLFIYCSLYVLHALYKSDSLY